MAAGKGSFADRIRAAWNGRQAGRDCAYFAWNYGITGNSELFLWIEAGKILSFLTVFVIGTGAAAAVAMQITSDETLSGIIGSCGRDYSGNRVCNFEAGRNVCDCLCTWSSTKYILAPAGESDLAAGVCWNWSGICVVDD